MKNVKKVFVLSLALAATPFLQAGKLSTYEPITNATSLGTPDKNGDTPLLLALKNNDDTFFKLLLDTATTPEELNLTHKTKNGNTVLLTAYLIRKEAENKIEKYKLSKYRENRCDYVDNLCSFIRKCKRIKEERFEKQLLRETNQKQIIQHTLVLQ